MISVGLIYTANDKLTGVILKLIKPTGWMEIYVRAADDQFQ